MSSADCVMNRIVVIGGGGHARVLIGILRKAGHDIVGYSDLVDRGDLLGIPYLGADGCLGDLIAGDPQCRAAIGLGKIDTADLRLALSDRLIALGFALPPIISGHAVVNEGVAPGPGTVVFDGVVVNCGARIGRACILNTNCTIEHDCRLGDDVHIAPGATLSGAVTVGDHCLIGTAACVIQGVRIGPRILVGAGATVVTDLSEPGIYVGCPAKRMR
jgi:sugar O-acyltransferase (sialic acid O-acetyltransferase NeuD family)